LDELGGVTFTTYKYQNLIALILNEIRFIHIYSLNKVNNFIQKKNIFKWIKVVDKTLCKKDLLKNAW